jgi:hypothetical protein
MQAGQPFKKGKDERLLAAEGESRIESVRFEFEQVHQALRLGRLGVSEVGFFALAASRQRQRT